MQYLFHPLLMQNGSATTTNNQGDIEIASTDRDKSYREQHAYFIHLLGSTTAIAQFNDSLQTYQNILYAQEPLQLIALPPLRSRLLQHEEKITTYQLTQSIAWLLATRDYLETLRYKMLRDLRYYRYFGTTLATWFGCHSVPTAAKRRLQQCYQDVIQETSLVALTLVKRSLSLPHNYLLRKSNVAWCYPHAVEEYHPFLQLLHDAATLVNQLHSWINKEGHKFPSCRVFVEQQLHSINLSLNTIGLSSTSLYTLSSVIMGRIWGKGSRIRAELPFWQCMLRAEEQWLKTQALPQKVLCELQWHIYANKLQQCAQWLTQLNKWWQRTALTTVKLWQNALQQQLTEHAIKCCRLWLDGLCFSQVDLNWPLLWQASLPTALQACVQTVIAGINQVEQFNATAWEQAFVKLVEYTERDTHVRTTLLPAVVKNAIAPLVEHPNAAGYLLVYRYQPSIAYTIANPQWDDIVRHLSDAAYWTTTHAEAEKHLAFLLGINHDHPQQWHTQLILLSEHIVLNGWLSQPIAATAIQRLTQLCQQHPQVNNDYPYFLPLFDALLTLSKDQTSAFSTLLNNIKHAAGINSSTSLTDNPHALLQSWLTTIKHTIHLVTLLEATVAHNTHPFYPAATDALNQLAACIAQRLARQPLPMRTRELKHLLEFFAYHSVINPSLQNKLRTILNTLSENRNYAVTALHHEKITHAACHSTAQAVYLEFQRVVDITLQKILAHLKNSARTSSEPQNLSYLWNGSRTRTTLLLKHICQLNVTERANLSRSLQLIYRYTSNMVKVRRVNHQAKFLFTLFSETSLSKTEDWRSQFIEHYFDHASTQELMSSAVLLPLHKALLLPPPLSSKKQIQKASNCGTVEMR